MIFNKKTGIKNLILTVSLRISERLSKKINQRVINDNYRMQGKSRWIKEALNGFFELEDYIELVGLSREIEQPNKTITVRIPRELVLRIEHAITEIRKVYPSIEGIKSRIIRTAIIQRLLR